MKRISGRFMVLILLSVALMLSGCAGNAQAFTVTYDLGYDDKLETEYVYEYESLLEEPERPYRVGYSFDGWWYSEDGYEKEWNFEIDIVTEDLTLCAKWEKQKKTLTQVTLDANGGVCEYYDLALYFGEEYKLPIPQKEGSYFGGWYIKGSNYDYTEGIWDRPESNITFIARWISVPKDMTVKIGRFEQDGNTENGAEEIEWYVVDYKEGKYLLLSKYLLHEMVCVDNNNFKNETYEDYPVRQWLVGEFYEFSFTEEEKKYIESTYLSETLPSEKIFLLNKKEIKELVFDFHKAIGVPSDNLYKNAIIQAFNVSMGIKTKRYCLRDGGEVDGDIYSKVAAWSTVRPAMWINESYVTWNNEE